MRDKWPSRMIFIFAAVGSAAGLGNLWRFPYLTYKYGGGAFLIPYFTALLLIGIPLLALEFGLGQKFKKSAVGSFRELNKHAGTVGWWALGCGFVILSYYAVVMAWSLRYFFSSFTTAWSGGSETYFFNTVLNISEGVGAIGGFNLPILGCLLLAWIMIYFSIWKGVKSVSKVVKITMPLPIILIVVLLIRAVTLEGAGTGLLFYLQPNFSAILDSEVWLAAASQIFFTLSLGFGVMIAYASYVKDKEDAAGNTLWTALLNSSISILAGFVVFGTLGFLAMQTGLTVADVATDGPGLAFVVFPEALNLMPMPWLFSLLFFLTLLSLGIDSAFSLIEGFTAAFRERIKASTPKIAFWCSAVCFLAGVIYTTNAGLYFLDIIDHFITNYGLVLVGILQALVVGWTAKGKELITFFQSVSPWFPAKTWHWFVKWPIPIALIVMIVTFFLDEIKAPYEGYPAWAIAIGWSAIVIPLVLSWFLNHWYGKGENVKN